MMPCSRSRSARCSSSVGNSSGCADGSSTSWANSTARAAASGRRAHQRCKVEGWPCRIDFSRADARLIASSGRATSISLRFGASTAPSLGSVVIGSERLQAARPGCVPLAAVAGCVEVAGFEAGEWVLEVADLVVLWAAGIDAHKREAVARRAVQCGERLVVGDEEVLGAGETSLDLDPERVFVVALGQDVEAGVIERLLDRGAAERAFGREHEVDTAALDLRSEERRVG